MNRHLMCFVLPLAVLHGSACFGAETKFFCGSQKPVNDVGYTIVDFDSDQNRFFLRMANGRSYDGFDIGSYKNIGSLTIAFDRRDCDVKDVLPLEGKHFICKSGSTGSLARIEFRDRHIETVTMPPHFTVWTKTIRTENAPDSSKKIMQIYTSESEQPLFSFYASNCNLN